MKLDDILNEGMFSRSRRRNRTTGMNAALPSHQGQRPTQRGQGHAWRGDMKFEKQAQIFKRFLQRFPINELASIYSNAVSSGRFSSEELGTVRKAMMQRRWPKDEIQMMTS